MDIIALPFEFLFLAPVSDSVPNFELSSDLPLSFVLPNVALHKWVFEERSASECMNSPTSCFRRADRSHDGISSCSPWTQNRCGETGSSVRNTTGY